ncbi:MULTISPECIES: lanthionine synthetase LanC family protein [unclassified Rhizobium]|uniref:lanthionine synthetase LanC family protein n=1 Tax=unclassified Rhizobium TaxID=2613769 RepID=UPI00177EEBC5|nr:MULTISPECIES: lanthionine synthetase LanC family protein [unclassified Rhizobium]MBD8689734.1 hypothetical protein [Rhizobium sp. CFBP 13644]MBD8693298.1 hypothetical protein [Rhizobium sp. CFBP 13717]
MSLMTLPTAQIAHGQSGYLEAASRIGMQLCRDAMWHDGRCTWMGWAMTLADGSATAAYRTASASLYDGVAGIALFLGRLAVHAPSAPLLATVDGAVRQVQSRLADFDALSQRSFYTGSLGAAYMLYQLGRGLNRPEWTEQGLELAERHAALPFGDDALDVIAGSGSAIPGLIYMGKHFSRPVLTAAAVRHAEQLLAKGVVDARGLSWPSLLPKHNNLLGYAHGVSGMAMALLEAYAVSGDDALLHGAQEAIRYERNCFDPAQQGWPDFRVDTITAGAATLAPTCNCTWCSGSTGIGLTRLRMMELLPADSGAAEEVNIALQGASRLLMSTTTPQDLCLCHGLCGTADFVLSAGVQLNRPDIAIFADQVGDFIIEHYLNAEQPLPCGVQQRGEAPGLMMGKAGIGYFFLRLIERQTLQSVLLLKG